MIEVSGLTKKYNGKKVVDEVSFRVSEGGTLILLGTSGSGKSTTLKMLNRLIEPDSGSISINDQNILLNKPEEIRKKIGYVIQNIGLFPHYTVAENIATVPKLLGWGDAEIKKKTDELLNMTGLDTQLKGRYPHELAAAPPVVLLDEPFGALDPLTRTQIQREFMSIEALRNKTMVLVTHDVSEAVTLGGHICLLDQGKVQQLGTPQELIFRPHNDFVKRFFDGHRFTLELQVLRLKDILKQMDSQGLREEMTVLEVLEILESNDESLKIIKNDVLDAVPPQDILKHVFETKNTIASA